MVGVGDGVSFGWRDGLVLWGNRWSRHDELEGMRVGGVKVEWVS
jgi:hypothetical protein